MNQQERDLRELMCRVGQFMYQNGYVDATGGNISARLDADRILVSPSGLATGFLEPEQMLVVNLAGERADLPNAANRGLRPTSELPMHLECYRHAMTSGCSACASSNGGRSDAGGIRLSAVYHTGSGRIAGIDADRALFDAGQPRKP